jgi:tRNA(fMet)-specific endonuclease VapC
MKVLLDSDTCVELIRGRSAQIGPHVRRYEPGEIGISSITFAELSFGVAWSAHPERNAAALAEFVRGVPVIPFDTDAAQAYGPVRAALERAGKKIGALDTLIAAHALSLGVTLVTHNTREFARVKGLDVVDWSR